MKLYNYSVVHRSTVHNFTFKPMYTVQSNPIKLGAVYNFTFKPMYTVQSNPIKLGAVYNFTIECIEDYKLI